MEDHISKKRLRSTALASSLGEEKKKENKIDR
jgi:hypothetical protein